MNFYHILFGLKHGFNRNLTWYENLFVKFYNNTIAKLVAKILRIKGNTISFNQLITRTIKYEQGTGITKTVNSNGSISFSGTATSTYFLFLETSNIIPNHKIYIKARNTKIINDIGVFIRTANDNNGVYTYPPDGNEVLFDELNNSGIFLVPSVNRLGETIPYWNMLQIRIANGIETNLNITPQIFDLTLMGIDNLATTAEVENWLSTHIGNLPYYDYTTGKLISFNGTGIKTTGKNLLGENFEQGAIFAPSASGVAYNSIKNANNYRIRTQNVVYLQYGYTFAVSFNSTTYDAVILPFDTSGLSIYPITSPYNEWKTSNFTFTSPGSIGLAFKRKDGAVITPDEVSNIQPQIEIDSATTYEPYTSNTLSLPISTFFPTGMKSAGSVYDELTPSKATTRIGSVDLGNLVWNYATTYQYFYATLPNMKVIQSGDVMPNFLTPNYITITSRGNQYWGDAPDKSIGTRQTTSNVCVKDLSYTDVPTFTNAMSGQYLCFELGTETETSISPELDLTYPIEWGGTEQILPVNTSTPTTSAIVADIHYPDGDRTDQTFVYRVIEKVSQLGNRALSIMLGKSVKTDNPEEPLNILLKGEK